MSKKNLLKLLVLGALVVIISIIVVMSDQAKTVKFNQKTVIATVNEIEITQGYLEKKFQSLPEEYKGVFQNDREGFLDELIIRELLYQEAERLGLGKNVTNIDEAERKKDAYIQELIRELTKKVKITETEMKSFYSARQTEMKGMDYEEVKASIQAYLTQQKQGEMLEKYISDLKNKAKIVKNMEWIKAQEAAKPKNALDDALKNGKPTVLDLGSDSCIPCQMMKPIFEELEKEYKGRANIILLDVYEYRDLANKYRVRAIPTQVFFDKDGNQVWRHEGFLAKEEIIKKLQELGVK